MEHFLALEGVSLRHEDPCDYLPSWRRQIRRTASISVSAPSIEAQYGATHDSTSSVRVRRISIAVCGDMLCCGHSQHNVAYAAALLNSQDLLRIKLPNPRRFLRAIAAVV